MGRRPDAPYFILLFQKQVKCSRKGNVFTFFLLLQKEPKARTACFLGRGRRPDAPYFILLFQKQVKYFRKGTGLRSFRFYEKNQK